MPSPRARGERSAISASFFWRSRAGGRRTGGGSRSCRRGPVGRGDAQALPPRGRAATAGHRRSKGSCTTRVCSPAALGCYLRVELRTPPGRSRSADGPARGRVHGPRPTPPGARPVLVRLSRTPGVQAPRRGSARRRPRTPAPCAAKPGARLSVLREHQVSPRRRSTARAGGKPARSAGRGGERGRRAARASRMRFSEEAGGSRKKKRSTHARQAVLLLGEPAEHDRHLVRVVAGRAFMSSSPRWSASASLPRLVAE